MIRWLLAFLLLPAVASAHDPREPDAAWFNSLKQPSTGISCCSVSDCKPVDDKIAIDHYEAMVNGQWLPIPVEKVLHRENPTGRAVLCQSPATGTIYCFVPNSET